MEVVCNIEMCEGYQYAKGTASNMLIRLHGHWAQWYWSNPELARANTIVEHSRYGIAGEDFMCTSDIDEAINNDLIPLGLEDDLDVPVHCSSLSECNYDFIRVKFAHESKTLTLKKFGKWIHNSKLEAMDALMKYAAKSVLTISGYEGTNTLYCAVNNGFIKEDELKYKNLFKEYNTNWSNLLGGLQLDKYSLEL